MSLDAIVYQHDVLTQRESDGRWVFERDVRADNAEVLFRCTDNTDVAARLRREGILKVYRLNDDTVIEPYKDESNADKLRITFAEKPQGIGFVDTLNRFLLKRAAQVAAIS